MRNIDALKRLAAKLTACGTAANASGKTFDEVIDYIANNCNVNYDKLTLKDSDGAVYDITVSTTGSLVVTPKVKVATPTFSPATGTQLGEGDTVTITCATTGATIYYTIDGSAPTKESSVYSTPITLEAGATVKAFADKAACTDSDVGSATYTVAE